MNLDWGWFSIGIPTLKIFDNLIVRQYQYDTEMSRLFRSPKVMSQVESNSAWSTPHHHGTRLTWNKTEDPTDWYHPPAEDQTWTPTSETPNPRISLREKTVFWGVPCQFGIHKDISQKKISQYHRVTKTGSLQRSLVSGVTLLPWLLIRAVV